MSNRKIDDHMVVVTAVTGEKFVGWVPEDVEDVAAYMNAAPGWPKKLEEVRSLLVQITPQIQKVAALIPIDILNEATPEYWVLPSSWYQPVTFQKALRNFEALLKTALENELRAQAASAGLVLPGEKP